MLVPVKLPAVLVLEILRPALLSHAIVIPGSRAAVAPDRHVVAAIISACNYGKAEIRMNQLYVSVVVNGLMIGAVYALIAVGLNIIFGVMRGELRCDRSRIQVGQYPPENRLGGA